MNLLKIILGLWLLILPILTHAEKPLTIGMFPYVAPAKLITHQKGLIKHLEKGLTRPINMVTAKNFKIFIQNAKKGQYDLLYSAPHLAYFLEKNLGYKRIAMTQHHIQGVFIVQKKSPYKKLTDLKGSKIAITSPLAILHQIAIAQLTKSGLTKGKDYSLNITKSHDNSIFSLFNGESDAAVTGIKIWKRLDSSYKNGLRLLVPSDKIPGFIIMAKPDLSTNIINKLRLQALSFNQTMAGKKYLFTGITRIDDKTMQSLAKYSTIIK